MAENLNVMHKTREEFISNEKICQALFHWVRHDDTYYRVNIYRVLSIKKQNKETVSEILEENNEEENGPSNFKGKDELNIIQSEDSTDNNDRIIQLELQLMFKSSFLKSCW